MSSIHNKKLVELVALVLAFAMCVAVAQAQQIMKIARLGFLDPSSASGSADVVDTLRQELSKLGWSEGKNLTVEYRFAELKSARLAELAAELVRLKVDLIVASGVPSAVAAKNASTTTPIVMVNAGDPVGQGLVGNLARPGGNVTGLSNLGAELNTKRLEILKDVVLKLARVGLLRPPAATVSIQLKELRATAVALKLKLEEIETPASANGLESAFQTAKQKQVNAIMTSQTRQFSPKENGSSKLLVNTKCRLFITTRRL
jgi:putative tryptophan/tyrosine transport system substrate-binding protein